MSFNHPDPELSLSLHRYQDSIGLWLQHVFGDEIANDKEERGHRFIEEALELVQALGCTKEHVYRLVDYVFDRPVGNSAQEVGGVMVTLAAACYANKIDLAEAAKKEHDRVWLPEVVEKVRAKQATKPLTSPLPGRDDRDPIPPDIYYSAESDNFFDVINRHGQGLTFYRAWYDRRSEFPIQAPDIAYRYVGNEVYVTGLTTAGCQLIAKRFGPAGKCEDIGITHESFHNIRQELDDLILVEQEPTAVVYEIRDEKIYFRSRTDKGQAFLDQADINEDRPPSAVYLRNFISSFAASGVSLRQLPDQS